MPGYVLPQLVLATIAAVGVGSLGTMAYLGYTGRWRRFLTVQPWLLPVGRYWGLLASALWAACVAWVGAAGCIFLWLDYRSGLGPVQGFLAFGPFPIVVGAAGFLFSWWLPRSWRPRWLRDHDAAAGRDAPDPRRRPWP